MYDLSTPVIDVLVLAAFSSAWTAPAVTASITAIVLSHERLDMTISLCETTLPNRCESGAKPGPTSTHFIKASRRV